MRIIKLAILSFVILFAVLTCISLIIPSHIHLSKVITLNKGIDSVFKLVKDKEQWPRWHPAFMGDSIDQRVYNSIQVVVLAQTDSLLQVQWLQPHKKPLNMGWQLFREPNKGFATLQWYMDFTLSWYPWEKFGSLFYEMNYGRLMEEGLYNIKKEVEK